MTDAAGALNRLRLAVGETDAVAAVTLKWFDGEDWSGADPALVEHAGFMLGVLARLAADAASKLDSVHVAVADVQPVPAGQEWDYEGKGTASAPGGEPVMSDAEIVRRIRARCPDDRYKGSPDAELVQLFQRNKQVLGRSDDDVIAAMVHEKQADGTTPGKE